MSLARTFAVIGRRTCAGLAVTSAVLHAGTIGRADTAAVLMAAMSATCLFCAYELWMRGSTRTWLSVAVMNLVMIGAHLSAPGHHHGSALGPVANPSTLTTAATCLAGAEALIAAAVLYVRTRDHRLILLGQ